MKQPIDDVHLRRGRLLERIATERRALAHELKPTAASLAAADRLLARAREAADYLKQHLGVVVLAVGTLAVVRPRRAWRWARRGLLAWQTWRTLRNRFLVFADRFGG